MDFSIFSDISEMETLASDERFDRYDNPSEDRKLDGLLYDVAVCGEYSSDELSFEIFAYEFESPDIAKQYFENVTGKVIDDRDRMFNFVSGHTVFELIVVCNEKAYSVYTTTSQKEQLKAFLGEIFSVKVNNYNPNLSD